MLGADISFCSCKPNSTSDPEVKVMDVYEQWNLCTLDTFPVIYVSFSAMTPQDYIKKYCIITSRRQNLYQKIFLKNKDKSGQILFKVRLYCFAFFSEKLS